MAFCPSKTKMLALTKQTVSLAIVLLLAASALFGQKADLALIRPATNTWYLQAAENGAAPAIFQWGLAGDVRVPADYDGDGVRDIAVWRPANGVWYVIASRTGEIHNISWGLTTQISTGKIEDVPVPADYNGDGADDFAVWRPDEGRWYVLTSHLNGSSQKIFTQNWGILGDIPVPADYDGDRLVDVGVFRPMNNTWYIMNSSNGHFDIREFGRAGDDLLVPADYSGDGRADLAVFRNGTWFVAESESGEVVPFVFGYEDSVPVPADYDGDGVTDFAVYRRGTWMIYDSGEPRFRSFNFGREEDVPLNSLSVRPSIIAVP